MRAAWRARASRDPGHDPVLRRPWEGGVPAYAKRARTRPTRLCTTQERLSTPSSASRRATRCQPIWTMRRRPGCRVGSVAPRGISRWARPWARAIARLATFNTRAQWLIDRAGVRDRSAVWATAHRWWPKPSGNIRKERNAPIVECPTDQSTLQGFPVAVRQSGLSENRGVPGSSPGLAVSEVAANGHFYPHTNGPV
jgi:hypothetical protein